MAPTAAAAAPIVATEATAATMSGPPVEPRPPLLFHSLRNLPRPAAGESSDPGVTLRPEPSPLANPMIKAPTARPARPAVSGTRTMPTENITRHGTAVHFLPRASITLPAG